MTTPALPSSWTAQQQRFMLWLALPDREREPKQQKALAAQLRVREATLSDWKHLPGFGDEVYRLTRELVKSSDLARIIHAQTRKAIGGDTQAARFVFEAVGIVGKDGGTGGATAIASATVIVRNNVPELGV